MKAKRFFSVLVSLFILSVLIKCSSPSSGGTVVVTPPPPKVDPPVLTVNYSTDTLGYGDLAAFSWKVTKDPNAKVTLNGNAVPKDGSYTSDRLFAKTTYKLVATGKGGSDNKSFDINVGDWSTSIFGLLTHGSWLFEGYGTQVVDSITGNITFYMYTDSELVGNSNYEREWDYLKDNRRKIYRNGNLISDESYKLSSNDSTIYVTNSDTLNIESITKQKFIYIDHGIELYDSNGDGIINAQRPFLFRFILKKK